MARIYIILLTLVIAMGCVSQPQTQYEDPQAPVISILSPLDGQTIEENTIVVELLTNTKLVPSGDNAKEGEGHFHVFLDGTQEQIGARNSFVFENVLHGVHTIRAELHKNDHLPYEGVVKTVMVNVGGLPATIATKQFDITAMKWKFEPSTIEVNQGDVVILKVKSVDVDHGFALSNFGVSESLEAGKEVSIQFTADKKGNFTFFCDVFCGTGHADMKGMLVVK